MKKHITIQVSGKVQGVWFRQSTKQMAESLGLAGYAKNNEDGTVTIEAVGLQTDLMRLLEWAKQGSDLANVESVDYVIDNNIVNYNKFSIL